MICPMCGRKGNRMGADTCAGCLFDLAAVDRPGPSDRVERSLMLDPVAALNPPPPVTVPAGATVGDVMRAMVAGRVGAVLVLDAGGRLGGIVTERDFLTKVAGSPGYASRPAAEVMTRRPEVVAPTDPLAVALGKMAAGGYRHLPVVAAGRPVGVVSVRDFLRHLLHLCATG